MIPAQECPRQSVGGKGRRTEGPKGVLAASKARRVRHRGEQDTERRNGKEDEGGGEGEEEETALQHLSGKATLRSASRAIRASGEESDQP